MNCPRCIEKMAKTNSSGFSTRTCHYCNGTWIPHDSLKQLLIKELSTPSIEEIRNTFHSQREDDITRTCPECKDTKLEVIHVHDIELDLCPNCNGLFFDEGELKTMLPSSHAPLKEKNIATGVATEGLFWIIAGFISNSF